eukprot:TRINITY_DN92_c0_g1_i1.p1 TRINITY_DN92_c0_g1~~TRINITY_DN92_c0_g1_i1.p1  ORF type:complete len:251 (+),score=75.13 TRINITY_DN92_c0_g1_i1:142-894(+)
MGNQIRRMKTVALALIALAFVVAVEGSFFKNLNKHEGFKVLRKNATGNATANATGTASANTRQICAGFVSQCKEAAKNAKGKDKRKVIQFCNHLNETINECYTEIGHDEACYGKCVAKTAKKTSNADVWFAGFLSCATCSPDYKKQPLQPGVVCQAIAHDCEVVAKKERRKPVKEKLGALCEHLKQESVQTECSGDVEKNPICFGLCVHHCHNTIDDRRFRTEDWGNCLESCGVCAEGAKERRNRRRNLH